MASGDSPTRFPDRAHRVVGERSVRASISPIRSAVRSQVGTGGPALIPVRQPAGPPSHNLPPQPRSIVGRERDLTLARQWLLRADTRLLTLIGPPGVGKTRLAIELAGQVLDPQARPSRAGISFDSQAPAEREYRSAERHHSEPTPTSGPAFDGGARFVDLAPIASPGQVADAIVRGLDLHDIGRRAPADALEDALREQSLLLILDNFEQVLDAADLVGRLLAACPKLKVLVTSRAPLHLRWERELPVRPLELPGREQRMTAAVLTESPAIQLFVERARAVVPSFEPGAADLAAIAAICAHLDGLPLAIELAAARVKLFPPTALLRRLTGVDAEGVAHPSPLRLLAGPSRDTPARQQTLWGAIAWSYDVLTPEEQSVFRRLAVFAGGCTLDAAERVASGELRMTSEDLDPSPLATRNSVLDLVESLIDKSLVVQEEQPDGEPRLRQLETLREYAQALLETHGEAESARLAHTVYYLDLAERAEPELAGPRQQHWLAILERERDNLRAVERRAVERDDAATVVRLGAALWPFWLARGAAADTRDHVAALSPLARRLPPSATLARALHGAGLLAEKVGDFATCRSLLEQSIAVARQIEDRPALASALDSLGRQEFVEGHYVASRTLLEESLAIHRTLGDRAGLARVLSHFGFLEYLEGHVEPARDIFGEGLALAREAQDQHRIAEFLDNLGNTYLIDRDFTSAARMFQAATEMWRELGQGHWLAMALNNLGVAETHRGELAAARARLLEALELARQVGNRRRLTLTLAAIATLAAVEGRPEDAIRLDSVATTVAAEIGVMLAQPTYALGQAPRERARQALGTQGISVAEATGRAMTLEQAADESLTWLAEPPPAEREPSGRSSAPPRARTGGSVTSHVPPPPGGVSLTHRELETAALIAQGLTNRQIAEALVVTEGTAANYVQRVLNKLGFNTRAQIAAWAVEQSLGPSR